MNDNLYLRNASDKDAEILFDWVNDRDSRENAFDSHIITVEEHKLWFEKVLNDDEQLQFIFMKNEKPIGQIRISIEGSSAEIDYSISSNERGYGYGKEIIRLIIEKVQREYPKISKLVGKVKPSNVASFLCFRENGFEEAFQQLECNVKDCKVPAARKGRCKCQWR